jgi:hypothetical protein
MPLRPGIRTSVMMQPAAIFEEARRRIVGSHREAGAAQQEVDRFTHRLVVVDHVNVRISGHR